MQLALQGFRITCTRRIRADNTPARHTWETDTKEDRNRVLPDTYVHIDPAPPELLRHAVVASRDVCDIERHPCQKLTPTDARVTGRVATLPLGRPPTAVLPGYWSGRVGSHHRYQA